MKNRQEVLHRRAVAEIIERGGSMIFHQDSEEIRKVVEEGTQVRVVEIFYDKDTKEPYHNGFIFVLENGQRVCMNTTDFVANSIKAVKP